MPRHNSTSRRLMDKGADTDTTAGKAEDEGLDQRARRGLDRENTKAYGHSMAANAVRGRARRRWRD